MLILSRRRDEAIIIDGNITVRVVEINRGFIRLGIEAPSDVTVNRAEIEDAIKAGRPQGVKR